MAKLPGIPSVSSRIPTEISALLRPMREILTAFTSGDNQVATLGAMRRAGMIRGISSDGSFQQAAEFDATPPPAPTGLSIAGALANIMLDWDATSYNNLSHTEIWRAETNSFALAQLVGRSDGRLYVDAIGSGATRFYWIRYVSRANITGPFNAQAGTNGATAYDASYLMDVLAANPPVGATYNPLLYTQATSIVIDGVTIPAGVYMTAAYVRALSVTNAQIANLAVDDAKIANLNAAKITTGYIDAARISVGSLDAKIANIDAAIINSGYINAARINTASIANVTISLAQIDRATVGSLSALSATIGTLRTRASGNRLEISDDVIKVFGPGPNLTSIVRVEIGKLEL